VPIQATVRFEVDGREGSEVGVVVAAWREGVQARKASGVWVLCGALAGLLSGSASAQAARPDLSPAAAARTVGEDWQAESTARSTAPDAEEDEERRLATSIDGLVRADQQTVGQALDRGATGVMWSALRPWSGLQPLLRKVRYWYVGRGIDAVITNDGSVSFHDKDGVIASPLPPVERFGPGGRLGSPSDNKDSPTGGGRIRGTKFSPGLAVSDAMRLLRRRVAHEDPHAIERAEFFERTRALRDLLDARARTRHEKRATQDLLQELARIWSAGASLTTTQQQEQTFALWDGCDEDEHGAAARAALVAFLQKIASARRGCPFDGAKLAALNASRRSREALEPCEAAANPPPAPRE
jgi:hypothetical protein